MLLWKYSVVTNLVDIHIEEHDIPSKNDFLKYRHKSGKLYACSVCKSMRAPSELNYILVKLM